MGTAARIATRLVYRQSARKRSELEGGRGLWPIGGNVLQRGAERLEELRYGAGEGRLLPLARVAKDAEAEERAAEVGQSNPVVALGRAGRADDFSAEGDDRTTHVQAEARR